MKSLNGGNFGNRVNFQCFICQALYAFNFPTLHPIKLELSNFVHLHCGPVAHELATFYGMVHWYSCGYLSNLTKSIINVYSRTN